ncbi:MAG: hypothetical protein V7765_14235 [Oleispira sp.]
MFQPLLTKAALALLAGALLTACSGGGSSSGGNPPPPSTDTVSISGFAVKGILAGADVEAFDITGTTLLASTTTNSEGKYTLPAIEHTGPILVKLKTSAATKATCDSAVGCSDASGNKVAFGDIYDFNDSDFSLSTVLPDAAAAAEQGLMVTPVTHLAAVRAIASGATTSEEIAATNRATATLLGLDGIDINSIAPVDITDPAKTNAGSAEQQLYATLVASIQTIAEQDPASSITDVINNLADDYSADGGLVGNSSDESKITLENIFTAASEVVTAAEANAADAGIPVDLDAAETTIGLAENEAANAEPDAEVIITPELEPTPDTTDALVEATAKGIALLNDLNTWQDALTEDNQQLVQPFEDQIMGTEAILISLQDHSKVLQSSYTLIGENKTITECVYFNEQAQECGYSEESSEFVPGPLLEALATTADLVSLTAQLQSTLAENVSDSTGNTFDYNSQFDATTGAGFEHIHNLLSYDGIFIRSLTSIYSIKEGKISHIIYTMEDLPDGYELSESFTLTLTQTNYDDAGVNITFNILNSTLYVPGLDLAITNQGSEASITFNSAADRLAYSDPTSELAPSLAAVAAIDIHLNVQAIETLAVDGGDQITTTNLAVNLDFDKAADNSTTSIVNLALGVSNNQSENINGDLTLTVNGDFSETNVEGLGFEPALDLANATAQFNGDISIATINTTNASNVQQSASFTGQINAAASFLSGNQNEELVAETGSADFEGTLTITEGDESLVFKGSAEVHMEAVKTIQGIPFKLKDGTEYHANKAVLFGKLTANQGNGNSASLEINAVVTADIAGIDFVAPTSINEGDIAATLDFGISSNDENHARYYVNKGDTHDDVISYFNDRGFNAVSTRTKDENFTLDYNASNCTPTENGTFRLCDITKIYTSKVSREFPIALSDAEKIDLMNADSDAVSGNQNDDANRVLPNAPESLLSLSAADYSISEGCNEQDSGDYCLVDAVYTATADVPADISNANNRIRYIKGLDAAANPKNDTAYSANCGVADGETKECDITTVSQNSFNILSSLSAADKQIMLIANENTLSRHADNVSCIEAPDDSSSCTFSFPEVSDTNIYIQDGAALDDASLLLQAMENSNIPDYFSGLPGNQITLGICDEQPGFLYCTLNYAAITLIKNVPAGLVDYHVDGSQYTDRAKRYLTGLYATPSNELLLGACNESECEYSVTISHSELFAASMSEDSITTIAQGNNHHSDYAYDLGNCTGNSCELILTAYKHVQFPKGLTVAERNAYLPRITEGLNLNKTIHTLDRCEAFNETLEYCYFTAAVDYTKIAQVIAVNEQGMIEYAMNDAQSNYNIPQPYFWIDLDTQFGSVYLHHTYPLPEPEPEPEPGPGPGPESVSEPEPESMVTEMQFDIIISDYSPNFDAFDFETDAAYIEVSAALSVKAQLTGLDDAELVVFVDRLGLDDAKSTVKLINGTRAIILNMDSTKGFSDPDGLNLMISNADTEMTITAKCATDKNDDGIHDNDSIEACEDDFNFKGEIFVNDLKVADLEDRNGLPVFRFSDGSGMDLVATPNLLIAPSAQ